MTHSWKKSELLAGITYNYTSAKIVGNNTLRIETEDKIIIRHFQTDCLIFRSDGSIWFNTDGYRSLTTRKRINDYQSRVRVWQDKRVWYCQDDQNRKAIFADGMVWSEENGFKNAGTLPDKKMIKRIKTYCNNFAKKLPCDLPSGGDCWYCFIFKDAGTNEHLISHIEEKYYVSSLLHNALKEAGWSPYLISMCFKHKDRDSYNNQLLDSRRNMIARKLYEYMYKRIIDGATNSRLPSTGF